VKFSIGDTITQTSKGIIYAYTLRRTYEYTNYRGHAATILVWAATYASCGDESEATTGHVGSPYMPRNCAAHLRRAKGSRTRVTRGMFHALVTLALQPCGARLLKRKSACMGHGSQEDDPCTRQLVVASCVHGPPAWLGAQTHADPCDFHATSMQMARKTQTGQQFFA
jgi:hypothetical protein